MNPSGGRIEPTLEDYFAIVRRRAVWFVLPIVVCTALAGAWAQLAAPRYRATAAVLLADSAAQAALDPANTNPQMLTRRMENEINFARSDATEALVAESLGFVPSDQVSIRGIDSADVLEFAALAGTPADAARFANTWAESYVTTKQIEAEASITSAVGQLEQRLAQLQAQRQEVRQPLDEVRDALLSQSDPEQRAALQAQADRLVEDLAPSLALIDTQIAQVITSVGDLQLSGEVARSGTARVIQVAAPPESEAGAPLVRTLLLGVLAGLVGGLALALAVESMDKTIKDVDEITALTGLPVLGSIPLPGRSMRGTELALAGRDHPGSALADGYHRVSTAFQFAVMGRNVRSVLVTSANQSEGKTTTSANLAWALASLGSRVALVDVDFRRPRLHSALGAPIEPGISNHLLDGIALSSMATYVDGGRLALITAGTAPPNPAEFVATREFAAVLAAISSAVDLVVLDAPPILPVADSQSLARQVDAVILTARAGSTHKVELRRAVESVRSVGGHVIGVVLIGSKEAGAYGSSYGYRSEGVTPRRLPAASGSPKPGLPERATPPAPPRVAADRTDRPVPRPAPVPPAPQGWGSGPSGVDRHRSPQHAPFE